MPATKDVGTNITNLRKSNADKPAGKKRPEKQILAIALDEARRSGNKSVKPKPVGKGQAAPPKPGYGQGEMGPPRPTEPPSAPMEQMRSTYGPFDPPGYPPQPGQGQSPTPAPMQPAPMMPPSDGQVPGQGMPVDPIDQQIQQLLLQKQAQLQQRMQPTPPQAPPQGGVGGGMPGMGQAMDPRLSPPPIGTGLQTMPGQGMPLQDPTISPSGGGGGGLAALLGGPPSVGKPPLPGSPPALKGTSNPARGKPPMAKNEAKTSMKKGSAPSKKVRGKNRPAAGGRGERKGKVLGKGQDQRVGTGQDMGPGAAPAANNPYVMVKGRPYEQMPNGSLMPMVSPRTNQEAQVPQPPQQAQATPMGPPPQQGGVAPIGPPPAGGMPPSPIGTGQGDPSIGDQLGGVPSPGRAGVSLGAAKPEYPRAPTWHYGFREDPRIPDPLHIQGDRTNPNDYNPQKSYRMGSDPQGYYAARKQSLGMIGQGQSAPDPAAAARAASPNTHITNNGGGVSMIGSRPAGLPGSVGGAGGFDSPSVPPVAPLGIGQSSKKSKPPVMKKSKGGY